jgi:hypothetical protein
MCYSIYGRESIIDWNLDLLQNSALLNTVFVRIIYLGSCAQDRYCDQIWVAPRQLGKSRAQDAVHLGHYAGLAQYLLKGQAPIGRIGPCRSLLGQILL